MEATVSRRDTIITRGEVQQKVPQNKAVMQSTVQKKITDLQRKIREATQVSDVKSLNNTHQSKQMLDIDEVFHSM